MSRETTGRFAPTPSGNMHAGNALCYLLAWLSAKQQGGKIVLRMEDADTARMSPAAVQQTMDDLLWLGLDWDAGPRPGETGGDYFQSDRTEVYDRIFAELRENGAVYPCFCTRKDLLLASAPHAEDGRLIYPGTCRDLPSAERERLMGRRTPAWRLRLERQTVAFQDGLFGAQSMEVRSEWGDFPIRRADGVYCYQFTAAVDDALMGVTQVVRSCDLLPSTHCQIYIQRLCGLREPEFIHIPMLLDESGERMAKRNFSLSLCQLRERYTPPQVLGRLAWAAGLRSSPDECSLSELLGSFSWDRVPKQNIALPRGLF